MDSQWLSKNKQVLERYPYLKYYTFKFDGIINIGLRGGIYTQLAHELTEIILDALEDSSPYPQTICFNRDYDFDGDQDPIRTLNLDDEILFRGFQSMSTMESVSYGSTDTVLNICLPTGSRFLYLAPVSLFEEEQEILTFPNILLKFKGISEYRVTPVEFKKMLGDPEVEDPEIEDHSYHFDLIGFEDVELEINTDFDLRFLFFLEYLQPYHGFSQILYTWPNFYIKALKNPSEFINLTDKWGYVDTLEEIPSMIDLFRTHLFELYSNLPEMNEPEEDCDEYFNFIPEMKVYDRDDRLEPLHLDSKNGDFLWYLHASTRI